MKRGAFLCLSPYEIYPPTHGGSTLIWNKLKALSEYYDIHLLSPSPFHAQVSLEQVQQETSPYLKSLTYFTPDCYHSCLRAYPKLNFYWNAFFSSNLPLSVLVAQSAALCQQVESIADKNPLDFILFEHGYSTLLLESLRSKARSISGQLPWLAIEHNIENLLWRDGARYRQYSVPRRLASKLQQYKMMDVELRAYALADAFLYISHVDQSYYSKLCSPDQQALVTPIVTSIEARKLNFSATHRVCFFGSLGYFPNIDGLNWFINDVWPKVLDLIPDARLVVPGLRPAALTQKLPNSSTIDWLGELSLRELDQVIIDADVMVSPIRMGSGIKIKNIVGIALGMPLVGTSKSFEGIPLVDGHDALIADDASHFAAAVVQALSSETMRGTLSTNIKELYNTKYDPLIAVTTWLKAFEQFKNPQTVHRSRLR